MNTFAQFVFCLLLAFISPFCHAQLNSPPDLIADIDLPPGGQYTVFPPYAFFANESQIVKAFNYARRAEEIQFNLKTNSLGLLMLPSDYTSKTPAQRALYLINQERIARAGLDYGSGPVGGLPLDGVENNISTIAQGHADDMAVNTFFGHTGTNGLDPYQRINASSTYGGTCHEFMTYSENIYLSCASSGTSSTYLIERAILGWIYQDAAENWSHRRAIMIQGVDDYSGIGYTDNRGATGSEGFLGIGISSTPSFRANPCDAAFPYGQIVVMNIVDPTATATCDSKYSVQPTTISGSFLFLTATPDCQRQVTVNWATAWEHDNTGFFILKSTDGVTYAPIGFVAGHGTSNSRNDYSFIDPSGQPGQVYYYKIRQQLITNDFTDSQQFVGVQIGTATQTSCIPIIGTRLDR